MEEHRISLRRRTFLKGRIEFNNRQSSANCLVRDLSATGARLELIGTVIVPDHFDLFLPQRDERLACTLSWRRNGEVGVQFEEERAIAQPDLPLPPEVEKKMKELEAEVVRLRRLIGQLKADPDKIMVLLNNIN